MHSAIRRRKNNNTARRGRFKVKRDSRSIKLKVAWKRFMNRKDGTTKLIGPKSNKRLRIKTASSNLISSSSKYCLSENNLSKLAKSVLNAFNSFDSNDQVGIWREMISQHPFNLNQLRALRSAIDERIKVDIVSNVPYEIARYIMSFLNPKDLCQAAQTCRSWRIVCEDNRIWREKCEEEGILEDNLTLKELFRKRIFDNHNRQENFIKDFLDKSNSPKSEWKVAYLKHMDVLRNWRHRQFSISTPFIEASPLKQEPKNLVETYLSFYRSSMQRRAHSLLRQNRILQYEAMHDFMNKEQRKARDEEMRRRYLLVRNQLPPRQPGPAPQQQEPQHHEQQPQDPEQQPQPLQDEHQQRQHQEEEEEVEGEEEEEEEEEEGGEEDRGEGGADEQPDAAGCAGPAPVISQQNHEGRLSEHFRLNRFMQLRCHEDSVITCLQFNPKTNTIVSGSDDNTLKVWCSATGRCITTLEGHVGGVWSSQLSPDDIVVSGSTDRTLKVWKAHTGELLHTLHGHTSTVRCLALDGDHVVSGSRDTTLRLWNIVDGECVHVLCGHTAAVRCVEYKNNVIVSGAYDHIVMVWDALTGTCVHELECHFSRIYSLQFDGKTIASGSLDSTICIWDAETGLLRHHLEGHTSLTSKMQLKGNLLVSANADSFCKIWDVNTGKCLQTLGGDFKHTSAITSVYFNNRHVVTSSDDGTVKLWDIRTGKFIRDLIVLPTASAGGVVWRIRASYTKLICAVGSRTQTEDTHLLVLDFSE